MSTFVLRATCPDTQARAGTLFTGRGTIDTPQFMPVGTLGTVKALGPDDLAGVGARIILGNTYHLYLRPGLEVIRQFGSLHRFMAWDGPILTDSGGFQVFSLAALKKLTEDGVTFQSHIDGSSHHLTPESVIDIQTTLDSDIAMCLDECLAYPATFDQAEKSLDLTSAWARRSARRWAEADRRSRALFGIVQGGMHVPLRKRAVEELVDIGFDGYALGGLSVGEPRDEMLEVAQATLPLLPEMKPRYAMGLGKPRDLVDLVAAGADLFDCVLPTRNARNGQLFTRFGVVNISNSCHTSDDRPVDETCQCFACRNFSRAYLRHLYMSRELLSYRLNTIHNVYYFLDLMAQMRSAVHEGRFLEFRTRFIEEQNQTLETGTCA